MCSLNILRDVQHLLRLPSPSHVRCLNGCPTHAITSCHQKHTTAVNDPYAAGDLDATVASGIFICPIPLTSHGIVCPIF